MNRVPFITVYSFSLVLIFFFVGCRDAQINPYETDTGIYSIYGAMDMSKTEHVIRVRDLTEPHQSSNSVNLDAKVTFFDLEQGTSQILQDSIVQFPVNYTHNFLLEKEFMPRTSYKVEVERSDGLSVSSYCTTPGVTEFHIFPFFGPYSCGRPLQLVFRNVLPEEQIRFEIGVKYKGEMHWQELTNLCRQEYSTEYNELKVTASTNNFLNVIFPRGDVNEGCNGSTSGVTCFGLSSNEILIRYYHLGPEWRRVYPTMPFDPIDVADVENGLGFLGAYRSGTYSYVVDP